LKLTVISDIHGNFEALKAVLADIDRLGLDTVVSLGDNIGYGPEPDQVVKLLRSRNIPSLMGNHELALVDPNCLSLFNSKAKRSLLQTKQLLSKESLAYLKTLPFSMSVNASLLVHGCPPASVKTYIIQVSPEKLTAIFNRMEHRLCMVGHTHELRLISYADGQVSTALLKQGVRTLAEESEYIVNAGSVGQPRDGNNNAKYVIWDSANRTLEVRFVPYNIKRTVDKIIALGLPKSHADRLW